MRITAFNGSPRGRASNTDVMVSAFLDGAASAGAQVENIYLAHHDIKHCQGCGHCINSGGECVVQDDMQDLLPKYVESDIVVFATPLMIDNISGMLKVFMDRTFCIGNPQLEKDENGESRRVRSKRFENGVPPKIVVIANGGYPERSNFQVLPLL
ncbi:MAG: flavodoxin family protein, partial [Clostridia bacterium]|nr:flavodoxin family protein [Clostridia bacterium]